MSAPAMHDHVVEYVSGDGSAAVKRVSAAYFASDDNLMVFKDTEHRPVFAVLHDRLVYVERTGERAESALHVDRNVSA